MKTVFVLALLLTSFAEARSIKDDGVLPKLVAEYSQMAAEGSSLAGFIYLENQEVRPISGAPCTIVDRESAFMEFRRVGDVIARDGGLTGHLSISQLMTLRTEAERRFYGLIGTGPFRRCEGSAFGPRGMTRAVSLQSEIYSFMLILTYED